MQYLTEKIFRNVITELKTNDILYIGLLVDDSSKNKLIHLAENVIGNCGFDNTKLFCHHMTIAFRTSISSGLLEWTEEHEGQKFEMIINKIGISEKACAVAVKTDCPSLNKIKHITLFTHNGGKPVDSNYIEDWDSIKPMKITGHVKIVRKF